MSKVRFYVEVPECGVTLPWPMTAWTRQFPRSLLNGHKLVAFDVDFPDELVRNHDMVVPATLVGVTQETFDD